MSLNGLYTEEGLLLAAKIAAGSKLTITRVVAGSGAATSAMAIEQTLTAGAAIVRGSTATLPVTLAEASAPRSYALTRLGVYANDPDAGEILYLEFFLDEPLAVTAGGTNAYRFYLRQTVGKGGITVACSPAGLLVDEDLEPLRENLAKKPDALKGAVTLHVSKAGSDATGNGSDDNPYLTIQKAINSLPKCLMSNAEISIDEGVYAEDLMLMDFFGSGDLVLRGVSEATELKGLYIYQCDCRITLDQITVYGDLDSSNARHASVWIANNTGYIYISRLNSTAAQDTDASYGFLTTQYNSGVVYIKNSVISNKTIAVDCMGGMVYLNDTVTGSGNIVGIRCGSAWGNFGGYVQKGGATLGGEEQKGFGGQIW